MRPDPERLDREYNNRARVPGHVAILERWMRDSAAARARLDDARLDLRYGDLPYEGLDVFPARGERPAPVLVFIHGGYWRSLDKADHSFVAPAFVERGAAVVVPNYALAPAVSIETIALECAHALAWVWRHAAEFGGDRRRIVVAGHSAGGHLAAMLLACNWPALGADLPADLLRGALAVSGLYDLEPLRHTPFLQGDLQLTAASVPRLSPAGFPSPMHGTLFAAVGADESDEFRRQNRLIRQAWGERAVPVCEEVPGRNHFDVLDDLAAGDGPLHRRVWELFGEDSA